MPPPPDPSPAAPPAASPAPKRSSAWSKRVLASRGFNQLLGVVARLARWLYFSGTIYRMDPALRGLLRSREPVVFACWHQDFLFALGFVSRFNLRRPTRVLASASRDGELMTSMAVAVGFRGSVRGSSARGGAGALKALRRLAAERRESLVIVCDGPRPPAFVVQPGAIDVAARSGLPLWLLRTTFRPVKVLERSWARFILPWPFGRGVAVADGPLRPPADLTRAGLEAWCRALETRMQALSARGARLVGGDAASPGGASASPAPDPAARAPA